jgi:putative transposase
MLRSRVPGRVMLTTKEKARLVRLSANLGRALDCLATIVHPDTIRRWAREARGKRKPAPVGRPRTRIDMCKLVLKFAAENDGWGFARIIGEIKKLGLKPPSKNTVKRILLDNGFDPAPKRGEGTWDEFLKQHAATLWQCDFLTIRSLTTAGFRDLFVIVFLHVGTRRVFITPSTLNPNEAWVLDQAKAFLRQLPKDQRHSFYVQHDRDTKFTKSFDETLRAANGEVIKSPYRAPNLTAFVERFHRTLRSEALDHFILFGCKHVDYIVSEFVRFYHQRRPHQSLENEPLGRRKRQRKLPAVEILSLRDVRCESQLGGVLKHYYRKVA